MYVSYVKKTQVKLIIFNLFLPDLKKKQSLYSSYDLKYYIV